MPKVTVFKSEIPLALSKKCKSTTFNFESRKEDYLQVLRNHADECNELITELE